MICSEEMSKFMLGRNPKIGIIISQNPEKLFWDINSLNSLEEYNSSIGEGCCIDNLAKISPQNVTIGKNVLIEEFVSIKSNVIIGDNCVIRSGSVIGSEGFQLVSDGLHTEKRDVVKHMGSVIIEDNVEIQHNTCVDKALFAWDATVIGESTNIDNLVHIAHGDKIGCRNTITAGTVIAGSTVTEDNIWFGINSSIRNSLHVEENAFISMESVVTKNVMRNQKASGNFAIEHSEFFKRIKSH